jgi:hypothetical protein
VLQIRLFPLLLLLLTPLTGCVSAEIDQTTPSIETLKLLRQSGIPSLALGDFREGDMARLGRSINIRGSTLNAPKGGTFVDFLRQTVKAELEAAGKLDAQSPIAIVATLNESRAGENSAKGKAALGAEFQVLKSGQSVFRKQYRVESKWDSEFIGALAIPEAFRQYNALYAELVRSVFSDPEFLAALKT